MLPHPSMSCAWEEDLVRPTRVLVTMFLLVLIVVLGTSGLIAFTMHDRQVTVAAQHETHLLVDTTGR